MRLTTITFLLLLNACSSVVAPPSPEDGNGDGKADQGDDYTVEVLDDGDDYTVDVFEEDVPLSYLAPHGFSQETASDTLNDLIDHSLRDDVPDEGTTLLARGHWYSYFLSFDAAEANGSELAVYLGQSRVAYMNLPNIAPLRSDIVRLNIAENHGAPDKVLRAWAAYVAEAQIQADLQGNVGLPEGERAQTAPTVVEASYLAALYLDAIEEQDPEYLNPGFLALMRFQMDRAMEALFWAIKVEGNEEAITARLAELRDTASTLSPSAAALVTDHLYLPVEY